MPQTSLVTTAQVHMILALGQEPLFRATAAGILPAACALLPVIHNPCTKLMHPTN